MKAFYSQKVAMTIDKNANHPSVRKFFVSHEGKKTLTVQVGTPSIYKVDYEWFFKQMTDEISNNINNPEYTKIMETEFSKSTPVHKIVNQIMLMHSFQKYFEYEMFMFLCGIPGVIMLGSEQDWYMMINKLEKLETFLRPIDDVLGLADWFVSCKNVLEKLLDTYKGYPDTDWWSRIMFIQYAYGSGRRRKRNTYITGWFAQHFMGMQTSGMSTFPSGINTVPLKLSSAFCGQSDNATLAAGFTGFTVTEADFRLPGSNGTYPSVQAVQGWGLLLGPDSPFRMGGECN